MKTLVKNAVSDLFRDDSFFSGLLQKPNFPSVNIKQTETGYKMEVVAPGIKKEGFKLEIDNGLMTISGETEKTIENESEKYYRKEYSFESFSRQFILPDNVNTDNVQANYGEGVLSVTLPKKKDEPAGNSKSIAIA